MIPLKKKPKRSKIPLKKKKSAAKLKKVRVALGWQEGLENLDLDIQAFLLNSKGQCQDDHDLVFTIDDAWLKSRCGSVVHLGDAVEGNDGDGDCETIEVDLSQVPERVESIAFTVNIYEAEENDYDFSMVDDAYVKVEDADSGKELLRFDLSEELGEEHAVLFAELSRSSTDWEFRPLEESEKDGFGAFCARFGLEAEED